MARGWKLKGQVEPISAIIVTGIVVSLVSVAYFWGVPLIQKRASMSQFEAMERFISNLEDRVAELSRAGTGEVSLEITSGLLRLMPYSDPAQPDGRGNNSLAFEFVMDQPLLFPNTTLYLGVTSFKELGDEELLGTYGESPPAVVRITQEKIGSQYKLTAIIRYRELLKQAAPKKGYVIALCAERDESCSSQESGSQRITLSYDKSVQREGEAANNGELVLTYIDVKLI